MLTIYKKNTQQPITLYVVIPLQNYISYILFPS